MTTIRVVPDELRFAITRKCNGECRHCYNQSGKDIDRLSAADFIGMMREVRHASSTFDRITLTGGEPLLEPVKVLQITRAARELGLRVRLVSRAWELDTPLAKELKRAGLGRIQIGLDSSGISDFIDEAGARWDCLHSWLRGDKDGFRKTVAGIETAVSAGLDVSVRYSLCRSNLADVVSTYRFVSELGASKFKFRLLFPDGRAKHRLISELISGSELAMAQSELIVASTNNSTQVEITQPCLFRLPGRSNVHHGPNSPNAFKESCPCGTVAAYVDSNGDVKYCLFDEEVLGNMLGGSLLDIWNSEKVLSARVVRCPLDLSGHECSAFKILYAAFADYEQFYRDYAELVNQRFSCTSKG